MKTVDREQLVAELVKSALERDHVEQAKFLDEACGDDVDLRAEVESLLKFKEPAREFIESPAYEKVAGIMAKESGELTAGEILGDYKILSLLGEGGMGEVYLAEDTKLNRKVAIKLLKLGLRTASIVRHFHEEERILAGLTHPNIAQLYSGGLTSNGLPYFVMEYVDGPRLDDYCREKYRLSGSDLSIRERLELFRRICSAVSYAHQHLVIHRDIKPANIRVTANGEPKLLDFGIAKLLDPATSGIAELTMTFAAVMTPEYASPEQVRGQTITTVSDVYSLGVVLYELLTEQKPYKISNRTPTDAARAVIEQEPTRPSTAVTKNDGASKTQLLNPRYLRGDLDNIVLKALRKEPPRRYASVGQFSEDIRRHLEGLPVVARKDSFGYRAGKFIQRHKIAVAAATVVVLALLGGMAAAAWEARVARAERDRARIEAMKASRINEFLQEMLGAADPVKKGVNVKVVDVLSEASRRANANAATEPAIMADVLTTLGYTYLAMGLYEPAEANLRAALEASAKVNGAVHRTTATAMGWLGLTLAYRNKSVEGESISRKAVALERKLHPEGNEGLGVALYSLGMNLMANNQPRAALPLLEECVALFRKDLGEKHGYYVAALTLLGHGREITGDLQAAEAKYRQAIDLGSTVDDRYRIFLAQAAYYLGILLRDKGSYSESEALFKQSIKVYGEILGEANSSIPVVQTALAYLYLLKGDYTGARMEYEKALAPLQKYFPADNIDCIRAQTGLGLTLSRLGDPVKGEVYLRDALASQQHNVSAKNGFMTPLIKSALGECLTMQARYGEAEPLVVESCEALKAKFGPNHPITIDALKRVTNLYQVWGKADEAARVH